MGDGQRRLSPGWLWVARIVWIGLAALALAVLTAAVPAYYRLLDTPCMAGCAYFQLSQPSAQALLLAGLSLQFYARWLTGLTTVTIALTWALASILFWRKGDHWMATYTGVGLLAFGLAFFSVLTTALVVSQPAWRWPVAILEALGLWSLATFGLLFPNGFFVPAWTWPLAYMAGGLTIAIVSTSSLAIVLMARTSLARVLITGIFCTAVAGAAAQVYRYRHISGPVERQQAKWIVYGFAWFILNGLVFVIAGLLVEPFRRPGLANALYFLIGGTSNITGVLVLLASFALAILRYRLWDIDVLIRRTLIYSVLTSVLAVTYFGSVLVLESAFRTLTGQGQNQLVTVVSTLAIAALFVPLRGRVQAFIDRRFYRRKYDAVRTLAVFAAGARDEVELEHLSDRLVEVVQDTMQPAHVSLWLKPPAVRVQAPGERLT